MAFRRILLGGEVDARCPLAHYLNAQKGSSIIKLNDLIWIVCVVNSEPNQLVLSRGKCSEITEYEA